MKTVIILCMFLMGCSQIPISEIKSRGADIVDKMRAESEYTLCNVITVGSWIRGYGHSHEKSNAWKTICYPSDTETPRKE